MKNANLPSGENRSLQPSNKCWFGQENEIVPFVIPGKKGDIVFDTDEHPRKSSLEAMAKLPPAFKKDGSVTADNGRVGDDE